MNKYLALAYVALLVIMDQATKLAAVNYLRPVGSLALVPGVFHLTYATNDGAAFGLFSGGRWFFVAVTVAVVAALAYYFVKLPHTREYSWVRLTLVLICGGALGNFIDRLMKGYVVDFLHVTFINFPVFNLADVFLVVGTAVLSALLIFVIKDEPVSKEPAESKPAESKPAAPAVSEHE
ncbi:MAG: signal peptidase II [Defluviitaleaceae bacterium]|nr:signal peptidase II [Defluviitaleaceae bacterium]